jgi:hypothetical protein
MAVKVVDAAALRAALATLRGLDDGWLVALGLDRA